MIELRGVTVLAGGRAILSDVSLSVGDGERVALLGRSGAGKTTTLKLMNGLVTPSSGCVLLEGRALTAGTLVETRRRIGYVMQQPALFPHRSVFDNVATVPRLLEWEAERTRAAVEALLDRLGLPPARFANAYPRQLSGGEQQRVAIARALVAEPKTLLCDEPFSALDPLIRAELQQVLLDAARATTLVFVTHDVREALRVGERVTLFEEGRIVADLGASEFFTSDVPLVRRFAGSVS
jgi:osmoprotectant transport system ATP-binding protein